MRSIPSSIFCSRFSGQAEAALGAKNTTQQGVEGARFTAPLHRVGKAAILHNKSYNDSFFPLKINTSKNCAKRTYNSYYVT